MSNNEWSARRSSALAVLRTLGPAEQNRVRESAGMSTTSSLGSRPKPRLEHGWAFSLAPGEHKAIGDWDYKYEYFLVREVERLSEVSRRVPQQAWSEGRE